MKKIIILCNHFAPDNTIAAVRLTKIARYLHRHDYDVTVIAEQKRDSIEDDILRKDAEGIKVVRADNSDGMKKLLAIYRKMITPIKSKKYENLDDRVKINRKTGKTEFYPFETAHPFIGSLDYLMEMLRQYDLFRTARKNLDDYAETDYIFTSYGDFFGLFAGAYLHRKQRSTPWIFDIRDAVCRYKFTPQYVRWLAILFEKYIWKEADCITVVSRGIGCHVPKKYRYKVHCVTNGYDRKDREGILAERELNCKLRFAYTGSMYGGMQNLSPVFSCIRKLINEYKMSADKMEFFYAGKESAYEIFKSQARRYELDDNCVYCGRLVRRESLKLQMESDMLLVSSFDYQIGIGGVITGKALEYMSADKPIIAIINGDIEHSELREIIQSANLGFAYEEAYHEEDEEALYQYLSAKYTEFKETGKLEHNPDKQVLKYYDYRYLCKKMMRIIESI